jgi:hypothetical protein
MSNLGFQKRNFEANQGYWGVGDRSADEVAISFDGKLKRDIVVDIGDLRKFSVPLRSPGKRLLVLDVCQKFRMPVGTG